MRENKTCPEQGWQQMPTAELDQILQAELEKEHPNEEVVLPILQELEEREKNRPVVNTPDVLEILEKMKEHETSSKQSKYRHRWITGIAAVAAVACIIVMALPRTVGAESLFDVLFRWTSSVFEFFTPEQDESNPPVEILFETDNPGLQQLHDEVTELGVTEPVVPMWLPQKFTLLKLKTNPLPDNGYKVNAIFGANDKTVSIAYRISREVTTNFEKEDSAVEVYEYADKSHFILENNDNLSIAWAVDGVECLINTDMPKEDVYAIIKSIYRRNLK